MIRNTPLAAFALLALLAIAPPVHAQAAATPNAAAAARLAKLKARQDAIIAAAKAQAAASAAKPVTPPPTATTATTPPAATAAPKASATAPATSASVKPATSAAPATSGSAAAALPTHTDTASIALDLDALKKSRPDRRHAEFLDLQARFGSVLADARATPELKQHAQRIAYLQRIRALAVKANDATLVKNVDALITTEETRDANALNALRTSALPVPTPVAAATAVAVPVTAAPAAGGSK